MNSYKLFFLSCRKNVPGSRSKPDRRVHFYVLQGEAHWLAAGPHSLGESLQSRERCGMRCPTVRLKVPTWGESASLFLTFHNLFFSPPQKHCERQKSSLRVRFRPSLFQHVGLHSSLAGKIQKLTVSVASWQFVFSRRSYFLYSTVVSPLTESEGQRLPEASAPQDACKSPSWGLYVNEGITSEFPCLSSFFCEVSCGNCDVTPNVINSKLWDEHKRKTCRLHLAGVSGSHVGEDVPRRGFLLGHHSYCRGLHPLQIRQAY